MISRNRELKDRCVMYSKLSVKYLLDICKEEIMMTNMLN